MGLEPVMAAAEWGDVAGAGRPVARPGDDVVAVAASSGPGAPGEDAGAVADRDLLGDRAADLIGVRPGALGQVDHRPDNDLGVGVATPTTHLPGRHQRIAALEPG